LSGLDPKIEEILQKTGQKYGLPREIWYPIVMYESGGSTTARAVTPSEDSRGLFQVNTYAYPEANGIKLYDPEYNANFQMPELKKYYDEGLSKGLSGSELTKYVARYGQRPQWTENIAREIEHYYSQIATGDSSGEMITNTSSGSTPFSLSDPTTWFPATKSYLAYGSFSVFLVILFFFSLYMVFIRNTPIEKIGQKLI
jgi:hypothetical protein